MTLEEKNAIIEKYGSKLINEVFVDFLQGTSIRMISAKYEPHLTVQQIEDMLRVNFYCLDAIIIDQKEEIEDLELKAAMFFSHLPSDVKEELLKKK